MNAMMLDLPAWDVLKAHIARNVPEYLLFVGALSVATVCTMPEKIPASLQDCWTWMRNSLQTAVPAARARHEASSQSIVTTPTTSITKDASVSTAVEPPDPPADPTPPVDPALTK